MLSCVRSRFTVPSSLLFTSPILVSSSRFASSSSSSSARPWFQRALRNQVNKGNLIPKYMFLQVLQESNSPKLIAHVCDKIRECRFDSDFKVQFCNKETISALLRCLKYATTPTSLRALIETIRDSSSRSTAVEDALVAGSQSDVKLLISSCCRPCCKDDEDVERATNTLSNI